LFFANMAGKVLSALLHAAGRSGKDMGDVLTWVHSGLDDQTCKTVRTHLQSGASAALDVWDALMGRERKLRGDVLATVAATLSGWGDPAMLASSRQHLRLTPTLLGDDDTLYVCVSAAEMQRTVPAVSAIIDQLLRWREDTPVPGSPLLVMLDETACTAPIPTLPEHLIVCGSKRVSVVTCWQDFAQLQAVYGPSMATVLNNSRAKLLLPGVPDPWTLERFATWAGAKDEAQAVHQRVGERELRIVVRDGTAPSFAPLREMAFGQAAVLYGNLPLSLVSLDLFYQEELLRQRAALPERVSSETGLRRVLSLIGR
jgi:type IV secretory pathway TraG/TraD family ATPase VirD4